MQMIHHLLTSSPFCCTCCAIFLSAVKEQYWRFPSRKAHHISGTTRKALYNRYTHLLSCDPACKQRPVSACGSRSDITQTAQEKCRETGSSMLKYSKPLCLGSLFSRFWNAQPGFWKSSMKKIHREFLALGTRQDKKEHSADQVVK